MKLGQEFDPRSNALNAWRLALATGVILCHSFPLTGRHLSYAPAQQLINHVCVDGFFAISGFLITASWLSHPRVRDYLAARALRILPGLYVCLVVTAFVIAPIGVAIQGGSTARLLLSTGPIEYVLKNSAVAYLHGDVGGTPRGIPVPGLWDGSLWSLIYELCCYLGVAGLGVVGLVRRRWVFPRYWYWRCSGRRYYRLLQSPAHGLSRSLLCAPPLCLPLVRCCITSET